MNTKRIQDNNAIIQACIDKVNNLSIPEAVELPEYEGEYTIIPSVEQQIMQTKHWAMGNQIGKDKKQNFPRTECYYPFLKEEGKKGLN